MPTRLKFKFSRVIHSFQLCRSKRSSSSAQAPVPAAYRLSPFNPKVLDINYPNLPSPPPSTPDSPSVQRHVSRKVVSVGCRCPPRSCWHYMVSDWFIESPDAAWKKEVELQAKPHKNYISTLSFSDESNGDMSPVMAPEKKRHNKDMKSVLSGDYSGCFSSDDVVEGNEENETLLFASTSFSYDSSYEFSPSMESMTEIQDYGTKPNKKVSKVNTVKNLGRQVSRNWRGPSNKRNKKYVSYSEIPSPLRASVLRRMISCTANGKVKESVAVVKKSEDPYEDFKRSMLEMILGKQIFEPKDLEELLRCFLSLNSRQYHGVILEAFSEIWKVLFSDSPVKEQPSLRV